MPSQRSRAAKLTVSRRFWGISVLCVCGFFFFFWGGGGEEGEGPRASAE